MKIASLYENVTADVIRELEGGVVPWVKSWHSVGLPGNVATRRYYSGINILILMRQMHLHGYPTAEWCSYKQAEGLGAQVRKGEKATQIVFVKKLTREVTNDPNGGYNVDDGPKSLTILKTYSVFNVAQIDGLIPSASPAELERPITRLDDVELFVRAAHVDVRHGQFEPCYIPSEDAVCLPDIKHFDAEEHYYATLLHECVHWTGHKNRLDRNLHNRFGTKDYAAEELVAELGAAFLCAHLGVKGQLRHAGYIASWLKLLKEDNRAIFTASAKASQAADYLRSFSSPAHVVG